MRVYFTNLGCKLNQAELEDAARRFVGAGHTIAPSLDQADLHVVNSCTVTHVAARDSRKVARRGRRLSSRIRTVLTGCYVADQPEEAARLAGVDLVVANTDKHRLVDLVHRAFPEEARTNPESIPVPYVPLPFGNSRALVKIEDGCNMRCSFCIIPATRGAQRSRPDDEVVAEVEALAQGGFQEVVVTGVQISAYRWQERRLADLVERLVSETSIARIRLTSIAPWQFDRRLVDLFASERLCRHVHLSLQSGCDATLERMRRPYSSAQFAELTAELRERIPGLAVTTDVIVGFPGEDDREFEQSLSFVERIGFARVHAFPYSQRPGTEACQMHGQVDDRTKKERMRRMLGVAERSRDAFWESQVGERVQVLWEESRSGSWRGTTDNYVQAVSQEPRLTPGLHRVRLDRVVDNGVLAVQVAA